MPAPAKIVELVDTFARHIDNYKSEGYTETQTRIQFVNPLFKCLGWDVENETGTHEAYKDVVHEDAIKIEGAAKAPDYSFRIGGTRKFFVEAKKPMIWVKNNPEPAYQVRRYAFSAKLPLSILTDFEEFAVYDCRIKPHPNDKAATARVLYLTYDQYAEKWDEIAGIFSKDAVLKGSFDKFADTNKLKRGTATVDDAILEEIEEWRNLLAKNIALRNPRISQRELNFAVQMTIDRIIFLRMCEGRGIEKYGRMLELAGDTGIFAELLKIFRAADAKYNSGLFHFDNEKDRDRPDEITPKLKIDDQVLKTIISNLYYPESPYEFAVIPTEILGHVYEQFLGKVIRLTEGHKAKVEDKPEVKKAGGVYYTPSYIVDYIVKHTVGRLLGVDGNGDFRESEARESEIRESEIREGAAREGEAPAEPLDNRAASSATARQEPRPPKTTHHPGDTMSPLSAAKLRILDPACGSGSFLLGAFQYLLDWHRDYYFQQLASAEFSKSAIANLQSAIYKHTTGEWRLTTAEKKRILVNNIFGVDIDPQAVEVTKLSLLLKVLENETDATLLQQKRLFAADRVLPDLDNNIKCGNSLIGPDFYDDRPITDFTEEERQRINAFDWKVAFPKIMKAGGFDAVIGNPPYIRMEAFKELKHYLKVEYQSHEERADIYVYFIERAQHILKKGGRFGMIVSNKFIRAKYGRPIREVISKSGSVERLIDFAGLPVFRGATVRTVILIIQKGGNNSSTFYLPPVDRDAFLAIESGIANVKEFEIGNGYELPFAGMSADFWQLSDPRVSLILEVMTRKAKSLSEVCGGRICRGIVSGLTEAFVIDVATKKRIINSNKEAAKVIKPFVQGRKIRRYLIEESNEHLIYTHHDINVKPFPAIVNHLKPFKSKLENRATSQAWYELQQPQYAYREYFEKPKIVFPDIATSCRFALDTEGRFGANTVYFLPTADLYLLGLLNSKLAFFYFSNKCAALEGSGEAYLRFFGQYMEQFPVRGMDELNATDVSKRKKVVAFVERMLTLHQQLAKTKAPSDRSALEHQIAATDRQIDELVYELYGLTEDEIAIVEEATER